MLPIGYLWLHTSSKGDIDMKSKILMALVSISLTGCSLLGKKTERTERTPQGSKSALKLFVKAGNEAAEALRRGGGDMRGKNLQGAHLQKLDFSGMDFRHADLEGARLQGTRWKGTQAQGANFTNARLQGALFYETILQKRSGGYWEARAIFKKARLQNAMMYNVDLDDLDFRGAKVHGAKFTDGYNQEHDVYNMNKAKWKGAEYSVNTLFPKDFDPKAKGMILDLRETDLTKVNVRDINWRNTRLSGVDMGAVNLSRSDFRGADLRKVRNLIHARLFDSLYDLDTKFPKDFDPKAKGMILDLRETDLTKVNVKNISWRNTELSGVDMRGLDLQKLDFRGANLKKVRGLDRAYLEGAFYNQNTKFPDDYNKTRFPDDFNPKEHGMILKE